MPRKPSGPQQLAGQISAFNISPKGHIEGALLEIDSAIVQVNFPRHEAEAMTRSLQVGAQARFTAELETDEYDHPVYLAQGGDEASVKGNIVRLNFALHGEVNGFHLDEGTFVHLKPEGAAELQPSIGDSVTATGWRTAGSACPVLEADVVECRGRPRKLRQQE